MQLEKHGLLTDKGDKHRAGKQALLSFALPPGGTYKLYPPPFGDCLTR
jgi:hypothetical protein